MKAPDDVSAMLKLKALGWGVKRAVAPLRRKLVAQTRATVRFETRPGEQMQIDFGVRRIEIGGVATAVFLFVATLGCSRRLHMRAYGYEKQDS